MPSKTEEYLALAQRTANGLTRYWESWTDYLTTASRLYKYPFADQLMIYAQRPDATACADFDIWNNRMNRYVRRGAKGIALLDESSGFPRLHYVFDVSDTGVRRNSRDPEVWQLGPDLVQPVSEMLAATYGISGERVSQQLADVAGKLVADYWDNNGGDIRAIVDGSFLMDYDSAGLEMQFKSAAAISITYTLLERCGFEPDGYFDKDSFQAIYNFSTPDTVYTLGAAVSDISREVLRTVERAVKTTIRRRNNERSQHEYLPEHQPKRNQGILLHWSNSFRFVHCAILSYTVHTVSNIVHISVIRWRKFVTKSELPTKKNDMVLFSVETGKRPCHFRIELIFVFVADASQVHRDVSADTSSPHNPEATPAYPSLPELQFSFWRTV